MLAWLGEEGKSHSLDPTCFAIGGDSAGANLSVATAIKLREAGLPTARGLLLNYGAFDGAQQASFSRYGDERYMLTPAEMEEFWVNYLGQPELNDPLVRPLHANLAGLPPCWLCVAQCDILLDENVEIARRLESAGTPAELRIYDGATHSFLEAVEISSLADRALREASEWLQETLS